MKTVIKENEGFRLTLKKEPCLMPNGLNNIEMIQEQIKEGEVIQTSTYQFFMTQNEMNDLAKALSQ
jgi:hypothetical protein